MKVRKKKNLFIFWLLAWAWYKIWQFYFKIWLIRVIFHKNPLHLLKYYFSGQKMQQVPPRFLKKNIAKNSLIKSWINYILFLYMFSFIIIIISSRNSICRVFFARGISPSQKWWQTLWGREISCSQWEGQACSQDAWFFLLLSLGGAGEGFFFIFRVLPLCSL